MSREKFDTHLHELLGEHDGFGQLLVVAIVVTTMLGALTGFLQIHALQRHDQAIDRADQWGALASQVGPRWDAAARLQVERYRLYEEARMRAEQARAGIFLGVGAPRDELAYDAHRWSRLAWRVKHYSVFLEDDMRTYVKAIRQATGGWLPNVHEPTTVERRGRCPSPAWATADAPRAVQDGPSRAGPTQDPNFPWRYLVDSRRQIYLIDALRAGSSREAEQAEKQFTELAVALTLFAVAVFLLGFSLSPYGRPHRRLFATTAALLVVGAVVWSARAALKAPHTPSTEAAAAYADGRVALERQGPGDAATALAYFNCAIALDPGFPQAYVDRAGAWSALQNPRDRNQTDNTTVTPLWQQARALADLERAEALGAEDPMLPADRGQYILDRGLMEHDPELVRQALELDQETARVFPRNALVAFQIALAELALGRDWRRAYSHAEQLAKADPTLSHVFVSRALTELNDAATRGRGDPRLVERVRLAKEHVVTASEGPFTGDRVRGLRVGEIGVLPGLVEFDLVKPRSLDLKDVDLYAQWYYFVPGSDEWAGMSRISGAVFPRQAVPPFVVTPLPRPRGAPCLASGLYRLELYANGRLVDNRVYRARVPRLVSSPMRDMNVSVCRPASWFRLGGKASPFRGKAGVVPGLADGFVSPDGKSGVLVLDVTAESAAAADRSSGLDLLAKALRQFQAVLPDGLHNAQERVFPFLGADRALAFDYRYPGGRLTQALVPTYNDRVLIGIVFGPDSMFTAPVTPTGTTLATELTAGVTTSDPVTGSG